MGTAAKNIGVDVVFGSRDESVDAGIEAVQAKLNKFSGKLSSIGQKLSLGVSAPLTALGGVALNMSTDFNAAMANVATLIPDNIARIEELKTVVQDMSIEVGKGTEDLSGGLFQVVSAFGDSADAAEILRINARGAAAGLATTTDAINLTSAVTKAYGDTSADAVQRVTDLAFQTNKLGQTTFPEMAAAMGRAVPLAKALGVSQEELFGATATLTGVTGNTSEVMTQLRATYQAFLKPTKEMADAMSPVAEQLIKQGQITGPLAQEFLALTSRIAEASTKYGELTRAGKGNSTEAKGLQKTLKGLHESLRETVGGLGSGIVQSQGFQNTLNQMAEAAGGNSAVLGKMFGSVEAINAVLALTGSQAENLTIKTQAMSDVTGASDQAFRDQTEGINKSGFTMQQLAQKTQVITQRIGDGLAPALNTLLDLATPVVDVALDLVTAFTNADPVTQKIVAAVVGLAAAAGPVALALSGIVSVVSTLTPLFVALTGPVGLTVAALAGVVAVVANWETVKTEVVRLANSTVEGIKAALIGRFNGIINSVKGSVDSVTGFFEDMYDKVVGHSYVPDMVTRIQQEFASLDTVMVAPAEKAATNVSDTFQDMSESISGLNAGTGSSPFTAMSMQAEESVSFMETLFRGFSFNLQTVFEDIRSAAGYVWGALQTQFTSSLAGMIQGTETFAEFTKTLYSTLLQTGLNLIFTLSTQWALAEILKGKASATTAEASMVADEARLASGVTTDTALALSTAATSKAGLAAAAASISASGAMGEAAVAVMATIGSAIAGLFASIAAGLTASVYGAVFAPPFAAAASAIEAATVAWSVPAATAIGTTTKGALGTLAGLSVPALGNGGIVSAPTLAMIGEKHQKEAVIPLDRLDSYAGNGSQTLILEVDGRRMMERLIPHMPKVVRMKLGAAL
ncbi:MAG: phage tail tape measure protein [Nitrospirales bacterium]|nr:phage tail tape measure protein [Nitrospirales bacterium]